MKRLAYRSSRFLSGRKKKTFPKRIYGNDSEENHLIPHSMSTDEGTPLLLQGQEHNRCCCGLFRIYGSDGVWAWTVAFANFFINVIIGGLERMSGILYVVFMNYFKIDREAASMPFSIQQAGRHLFGPLAGILGEKYGLRFITVLGGLIGSACSAVLYFKLDFTYVTIFWGFVFGLSVALTTTLNQVSVDQYFEKHRTTAGGFAVSGSCVGAFLFPVVFNTLLLKYGINGTFLIVAALTLNVVPAALILFKPPWKKRRARDLAIRTQYGTHNPEEPLNLKAGSKLKSPSVERHRVDSPAGLDFAILESNSDIVLQLLTMELSDHSSRFKADIDMNSALKLDKICLLDELECIYFEILNPQNVHSKENDANIPKLESHQCSEDKKEIPEKVECTRNVYDEIPQRTHLRTKLQDLYGATGTHIISRFPYSEQSRAWKVLIELRKMHEALTESLPTPGYAITSLPNTQPLFEIKDCKTAVVYRRKHPNSFWAHIKTAAKLHCNLLFLLICLCRGVFMMSFIPVITIIVDFALDKGLQISDDALVIAALSLGDLIGRLCLGWITDHGFLSLPNYMLFGMLSLGVSTATLPFMCSRCTIIGGILIFGILQGSLYVRHPILVSMYMESHEQAIGMGFINLLSGVLGFAHPAFIGYFRDTLGSYNKMFYLNGAICILVGLAWVFEPFLVRISSRKEEKCRKTNLHYQSI